MKKRFWMLGLLCCLLLLSATAAAEVGDNAQALTLNKTVTVSVADGEDVDVVYFSYKPTATAYYTFSSAGSLTTYGHLYNADKVWLKDGDTYNNFSLSYKLTAGQTYYLGVRLLGSRSTGSFTVKLAKTATSGSCGSGVNWSYGADGTLTISGNGAIDSYTNAGSNRPSWEVFRDEIYSLNVSRGVTSIGENAFRNYNELEAVTLPVGLTAIGERAFSGCGVLKRVTIPKGVTAIGDYAFFECWHMTGVSFPSTLKAVGAHAFHSCSTLTQVALGGNVTSLGESAFEYCWQLESIALPLSLKQIGTDAFKECYGLVGVDYAGGSDGWNGISIGHGNGCLQVAAGYAATADSGSSDSLKWVLSSAGKLTIKGTGAMPDYEAEISDFGQVVGSTAPWDPYQQVTTAIYVGDGITHIGDYAFAQFENTKSVRLPDGVTTFGDYAFYRLHTVDSMNIPSSLQSIGDYAMAEMGWNRPYLMEIDLPEGLVSIGRAAFYSTNLRRLTLPLSLKSVGDYALAITGNHQIVYAGTKSQWNSVSVGSHNEGLSNAQWIYGGVPETVVSGSCGDGVSWSLSATGVLTVRGSGAMADYQLEYNVSTAPWGQCSRSITAIQVNAGVTHVGDYAFYGCSNAKKVTLADSVETIGAYAFAYLQRLGSIRLPNSLTALGKLAFYNCDSLSTVGFSSKLERIEEGCFAGCSAIREMNLPDSVKTIGLHAVCGDEITVPASVTSVGENYEYNNDFYTGNPSKLRFLGPVPEHLCKEALANYKNLYHIKGKSTAIYCEPEYYESFKAYLLPFLIGLDSGSYDARALGTLNTGDWSATLSEIEVEMNENTPGIRLTATVNGSSSGLSVKWYSSNPKLLEIDSDGKLIMKGYNGGALAYAEVRYKGGISLAFCKVTFTSRQINSKLVDTLPISNIKANHIATSSVTTRDVYGHLSSYRPAMYVETDTGNQYYKELLALTQSLTKGLSSDREKTAKILEWVRENVTYQSPPVCIGETPAQAYWVYVNKVGNCQGFSKLAGYMLSLAGIPSGVVSNDGHMWNIVLLDGKWVMLDAQYGANAFYADYTDSSYKNIQFITLAQGDLIYVVDTPGEVKLAGVGINANEDGRSGIKTAVIPGFVTSIYGEAFSNCVNLTKVTIPSSVTKIGSSAFYKCSGLKELTIPRSVTEIGDSAFWYCSDLTIYCYKASTALAYAQNHNIKYVLLDGEENVLKLPAALKKIESGAFSGLSNIDRICIPATVTSIATDAFEGCHAIFSVERGSYAARWAETHGRLYVYE